jgi:hypothetical protein
MVIATMGGLFVELSIELSSPRFYPFIHFRGHPPGTHSTTTPDFSYNKKTPINPFP